MAKKRGELILAGFVFTLLLLNLVSAFGVSAPYWDSNPSNPLVLAKGETKVVELNLQNMVGNEDVTVKGVLKQGSNIASLSGNSYLIKAQTSNTEVPLTINIPRNAKAGSTTKVVVEFNTVNNDNNGMVVMGTGFTVSFDVIVSEETAPMQWGLWITIAIIIIALLIAVFFMKRKPSRRK